LPLHGPHERDARPLYKQQGGASLLDKTRPASVSFDGSSLVASEEVKSVMFFEVRNLPAQADWLIFSLRQLA